jgi:molybdopterin-containing oxidoreductase family membrane subunit
VVAISTYLTVSSLFWYTGLLPDLATLRDRAKNRMARVVYGVLALGWRGSVRHWSRMERAYLLMAALATPLVVSVHSVISFDFAVSLVPGYHSTVFPPYFVAGALYSGFAMVITIAVPLRALFGFHDFIRARHFEVMAKVMLAAGLVVAYGYLVEYFIAWYSGSEFERYMAVMRAFGPYAPVFWAMLALNVLTPQALWFSRVRRHPPTLFVLSLLINVGMWLERYVIVVTSTHRDYMPSSWDVALPTFWDWGFLAGSLGLFVALMFLFVRLLPAISIFEVRELLHERREGQGG